MKNVFLFFGAHDGSLINRLDTVTDSNVYGSNIVWDEVHLFEPQPVHEESLRALEAKDSRVRYHKLAVSTTNGTETFYVKGDPGMGYCSSTLDEKKFSGQLYYTLEVDVVNVIDWIRNNTNENDYSLTLLVKLLPIFFVFLMQLLLLLSFKSQMLLLLLF